MRAKRQVCSKLKIRIGNVLASWNLWKNKLAEYIIMLSWIEPTNEDDMFRWQRTRPTINENCEMFMALSDPLKCLVPTCDVAPLTFLKSRQKVNLEDMITSPYSLLWISLPDFFMSHGNRLGLRKCSGAECASKT